MLYLSQPVDTSDPLLIERGDRKWGIEPCAAMKPDYRPITYVIPDNSKVRRDPETVALTIPMLRDLVRLREAAGLTRLELARSIDAYPGWVEQLESGRVMCIALDRYLALIEHCSDVINRRVSA